MTGFIKRHYRILTILLVPYLAFLSLFVVHVPYDVSSPAYLTDISGVIMFEDEYDSPQDSYYTTSVFINERVSLFKYLVAKLNKTMSISETYIGTKLDSTENQMSGFYQKQTSLENAVIAGYQAAGISVNYQFHGQMIIYVFIDHHEKLKVGDVVTHINDQEVPKDEEEFGNLVRDLYKKHEEITITLQKAGKISLVLSEADALSLLNCYSYFVVDQTSMNPSYTINAPSSSGPSGGLLQALLVYDALVDNDLAAGRKIAGTGTISYDGKVGAIGSAYQKVLTAYYNHADIFFVPNDPENIEDAFKAYDALKKPSSLKIVVVATLDEAINYLAGNTL